MNNDNRNLKDLLKASGYNDVDNEAATFAPHLAELSRPMIRRVCALKKVQLESLEVETKFYKKVHELEKEFQGQFDAVNAKRRAIITGEHEPTDSETNMPLLHGVAEEALEKIEREAPIEGGQPSKGIPNFWLHTLNTIGQISDTIKEYDEPILKYLEDITTEVHLNPTGFTLLFHFAENPFFANKVLSKYYELDIGLDKEEPFEYDGPNVVKGKGCEIQWNEGKNVTQKIVKKKQKKGPNAGKFITKTVTSESFFNFFDPNQKTLNEDTEEDQEKVREDFEIGQIIRDQVIPRAVLFFTGEAAEDDEFGDFDEEEDDEDDGNDHSGGSADDDE